MNRIGQTFKPNDVLPTTYLVVEFLEGRGLELPYLTAGHLIVSLRTGKMIKVSEAYLADLEEKGRRLT